MLEIQVIWSCKFKDIVIKTQNTDVIAYPIQISFLRPAFSVSNT